MCTQATRHARACMTRQTRPGVELVAVPGCQQPGRSITPWCCGDGAAGEGGDVHGPSPGCFKPGTAGGGCWWVRAHLGAQRDQRVHGWAQVLAALRHRPQELAALREANAHVAVAQLRQAHQLVAHGGHLLVDVAKVRGQHVGKLCAAGGDRKHKHARQRRSDRIRHRSYAVLAAA